MNKKNKKKDHNCKKYVKDKNNDKITEKTF